MEVAIALENFVQRKVRLSALLFVAFVTIRSCAKMYHNFLAGWTSGVVAPLAVGVNVFGLSVSFPIAFIVI